MSTSIQYLRLYLHSGADKLPIGYLSQYGEHLRVSFDESYIQNPRRPVLSLAYVGGNETETQAILRAQRDQRLVRTDGHWPVYFQNLLPEGHNRERLALQRKCSPEDEFELLAAAGHDLMGAVEVEPVRPQEGVPDVVRHWHTTMGLDVLEPGFVEDPVEDGSALPGVVTKFSAVQEGRRYVVRRHGAAGAFILKLPSTRHPDLVQNEMTGYRLCQALELDCAHATIISRADAELPEQVPFDDLLAVRRFDRDADGARIHMEEFAQVLQYPPGKKYGRDLVTDFANVLIVLDQLSQRPAQDVQEFVRRFVAFVLMGNTDAHLKNWALLYPDTRTPVLAPLYDPICVTSFFGSVPATDYGVNRAIDQRLKAFDFARLESMLQAAQLRSASRLVQIAKRTVKQAQADWPAILKAAPAAIEKDVLSRLHGGVAFTQSGAK